MKKTVRSLLIARNICVAYKSTKSKFGYACLRNEELLSKTLKPYDKDLEARRIELASVDKDKNLIINRDKEGRESYVFTVEALKTINSFTEEKQSAELEYEGYIASSFEEIKNDIDIINALNGIVINVDLEEYVSNNT